MFSVTQSTLLTDITARVAVAASRAVCRAGVSWQLTVGWEVLSQHACCACQAGLTAAFRAGLSDVVSPAWITMFAPGELQTLISGAGKRTAASVPLESLPSAGCQRQRTCRSRPLSLGHRIDAPLQACEVSANLRLYVLGAGGGALDVTDLAEHTEFAGGYHRDHPMIANLWEVHLLAIVDSAKWLPPVHHA
jgi:hypothetical protein